MPWIGSLAGLEVVPHILDLEEWGPPVFDIFLAEGTPFIWPIVRGHGEGNDGMELHPDSPEVTNWDKCEAPAFVLIWSGYETL